ncbi:MAG: NAD(P)H-binding protein [Actinobacteria bacterium]|nr:NAD(P)H-binding protein [Actinomycetota bacterium]
MRILLTGGSGFLGGHVLPKLVQRGHQVVAIARSRTAASKVESRRAEPLIGDLGDADGLKRAFRSANADALMNVASLGLGHAPGIIEAAETAGIRRAVFVSTTSVFTRLPAGSKAVRLAAEDAIRNSELDWTIVRPTMIYGTPEDRNIARLLRFLKRSPVFPLPAGGTGLQQPVHVDDLADVLVAALGRSAAVGRIYDVGGPGAITFRQLVLEAGRAVGREPFLVPVPLRAMAWTVRMYERISSQPRLRGEQILRLQEHKVFDNSDAVRDLGYDPRRFSEGVRQEAELLL